MNELSDLLGSLLGGSTEGPAEGMDGLLDLLGGLVSTEPAEKKEKAKEHASGMPDLEKMMEIVSRLQADDKNIRLLREWRGDRERTNRNRISGTADSAWATVSCGNTCMNSGRKRNTKKHDNPKGRNYAAQSSPDGMEQLEHIRNGCVRNRNSGKCNRPDHFRTR